MKKRAELAFITVIAFLISGCGSSSGTESSSLSLSSEMTEMRMTTTEVPNSDIIADDGIHDEKTTGNDTKKTTDERQSNLGDLSSIIAEVPTYYYTAAKTGTISDAGYFLNCYGGLAFKSITDNEYKVYLPNGDLYPSDGTLSYNEYLGSDLYTLRKSDEQNINTTCLMNASGEILIPHEAAKICWIDSKDHSARRYLEVIYTTEITDNKGEAFLYSTDAHFSLQYQEGNILYKGYAKVFDTVKNRFVPNVQITNADRTALEAVGNAFSYADDMGVKSLYDENGKALLSCKRYDGTTDGHVFIVKDSSGTNTVYSDSGDILYKTDSALFELYGEGVLTCFNDDTKKYSIIDYAGNRLTKDEYEYVYMDSAGILCVKPQSGETDLIDHKGNVIVSVADENVFSSQIPGYFHVENPNGNYTVYTAKGEICDNCTERYKLLSHDGTGKFLVWNTQSYSLELDPNATFTSTFPIGLAESSNTEYKKGLYDLFNGDMILEGFYDRFAYDGQMVYGYKDDTQIWDIYKLTTNVPIQ